MTVLAVCPSDQKNACTTSSFTPALPTVRSTQLGPCPASPSGPRPRLPARPAVTSVRRKGWLLVYDYSLCPFLYFCLGLFAFWFRSPARFLVYVFARPSDSDALLCVCSVCVCVRCVGSGCHNPRLWFVTVPLRNLTSSFISHLQSSIASVPHPEMTVEDVMLSLKWDLPPTSVWESVQNTSSPAWSTVSLEHLQAQYCMGDTLDVRVDMRDHSGRPKTHGGDFILARIHSPKLQASTTGAVTDLRNGSYRVRFTLLWPVEVQVSVLLIPEICGVICILSLSIVTPISTGRDCAQRISPNIPSGYYWRNQWSSFCCQTGSFFTSESINSCLKGKTLYFMGDSTMRQWIEFMNSLQNDKSKDYRGFSLLKILNIKSNYTVYWRNHGHPRITVSKIKLIEAPYISRDLDAIGAEGEDTVVVIGVGQHFRAYPLELFVRRLLSLRGAIQRLQARSPGTRIFIKLENTRELSSEPERFSDWHGHLQNLAQRKVFGDLEVGFVDAWEMTVAANTFAIYPNPTFIASEVAEFLSRLCPTPQDTSARSVSCNKFS
nr:NXPE family member 1-like [Paramormyrops kingsleyae]